MSIILGDCVDVMAAMDADSIDAIVTDPPYGLEFMGKEWDALDTPKWRAGHGGRGQASKTNDVPFGGGGNRVRYGHGNMQQWHTRWATEALRVAKPGAYLLAFGGTRTVHRLTVAIEDAGWIIRDLLVWAYASGFPKSKSSLKPAWEPIVLARKPGPLAPLNIDGCRLPTTPGEPWAEGVTFRNSSQWAPGSPPDRGDVDAQAHPSGRWPANVVLTDQEWGEPGERSGPASIPLSGGEPYGDTGTYSRFFLIPKASRKDREPDVTAYCTCETVKLGAWESEGQGQPDQTASTSPARATSEATSMGGFAWPMSSNGSATSVPSSPDSRSTTSTATSRTTASPTSSPSIPSPISAFTRDASSSTASGGSGAPSAASTVRSPSNGGTSAPKAGLSTDAADPATSAESSSPSVCASCGKLRLSSGGAYGHKRCRACGKQEVNVPGSACRCSDPDWEEVMLSRRGRVNVHPTQAVKPTALMRHLIRLVTPAGGRVLDPFLGSGSTAKAAILEGFEWVGIEREPEYVAIAEARIDGLEPEPQQLEMGA